MKELYDHIVTRMSHEDLVNQVRARVRTVLEEHGMPLPQDARVLIDGATGNVFVLHGSHVWDGEAAQLANSAADEVLRSLAVQITDVERTQHITTPAPKSNRLTNLLFWGFNSIVIVYWCLWFLRWVFSPDFREWYETARMSSDFGVLGILLFILFPIVPLVAVLGVVWKKRNGSASHSLLKDLLLFEIPALVFIYASNALLVVPLTNGLRVFAVMLVYVVLIVWFMAYHKIFARNIHAVLLHWMLVCTSITVLAYTAMLTLVPIYITVAGYIPDLVDELFFGNRSFLDQILRDPMTAAYMLLIVLIWCIPLGVSFYVGVRVRRYAQNLYSTELAQNYYASQAVGIGTPITFVLLLALLSIQPSLGAYEDDLILLAQDSNTYESQVARVQDLVNNKGAVDAGLQATLKSYRYYLFEKSDFTRSSYYKRSFADNFLDRYLLLVAFPFIYDDTGGRTSYTQETVLKKGYERAYGHVFGYDPEISIAPRQQVELIARDIQALTHNDPALAEVTVTDTLTTFMSADQEVVYEFSLPEHAVVTGLRLGPSLEHIGQIAPRGAAQQVYTEQVRRMYDPALLEQTGPRQYRLRVYPVPGNSQRADQQRREQVDSERQRVQFTYVVLRDSEGIPLPTYTEMYNVLSNETDVSVRINERKAKISPDERHIVDVRTKQDLCTLSNEYTVALQGGDEAHLRLGTRTINSGVPMTLCGNTVMPRGRNIAILFDTSYAYRDGELQGLLAQLKNLPEEFYAENVVTFYPFSNVPGNSTRLQSSEDVVRAGNVTYFGKGNIPTALNNVRTKGHDAILILTGSRAFEELSSNFATQYTTLLPVDGLQGMDVIIVQNPDAIPSYEPSFEAKFASSRSLHITSDVQTAMPYLVAGLATDVRYPYIGEYWYMEIPTQSTHVATSSASTTVSQETSQETGWADIATKMIAGRAVITQQSRDARASGWTNELKTKLFDRFHDDATELGIVTPLSSYIALVNTQQQQRLDSLTGRVDKYTSTQSFSVTQPDFASPLGGGGQLMVGFGGSFGSDSADLAAPMMGGGGGGSNGYVETTRSFGSELPEVGMGPRVLVLIFVLTLLLSVLLTAFLMIRRRAHALKDVAQEVSEQ